MLRFCARIFNQRCTQVSLRCLLSTGYCSIHPTLNSLFVCSTFHMKSFSSIVPKEEIDVSKMTLPPHVLSIIKNCQEFGFTEDEIKVLMHTRPELMSTSPSSWSDIIGPLIDIGFTKDEVYSILQEWPRVLSMKKKDLVRNIEAWIGCAFGHELLVDVLTTHPHFLQCNHTHVSKRIKQYQIYFESKKRVGKLLLLAPNTLEDSWDILGDKLNYLDELCTDKSDVAASGVLRHSLFHIKARHEFLIRAGFYKKPTKNFNKKLSKNPKLSAIVNTTDKQFVGNSGLSMFEYEVFLEMYQEEFDKTQHDEKYDSDGSDVD